MPSVTHPFFTYWQILKILKLVQNSMCEASLTVPSIQRRMTIFIASLAETFTLQRELIYDYMRNSFSVEIYRCGNNQIGCHFRLNHRWNIIPCFDRNKTAALL